MLVKRCGEQRRVDANTRYIDPGIDASEQLESTRGRCENLRLFAHVSRCEGRSRPARARDFGALFCKRICVARDQKDGRTLPGRLPRGNQANSGGRPRYHDHLVPQRLQPSRASSSHTRETKQSQCRDSP